MSRTGIRFLGAKLRVGFVLAVLMVGTLLVGADAQNQAQPVDTSTTTTSSTFTSGIQVQNLSSTTANVLVTYYNPNGTTAATQQFTVPGNGSYTVFGNSMSAPAGFSGSVVVSADQPVAAITNLLASNPTMGEAYDGVSSTGVTNSTFVPLFQQGNGGYNTSIYIQNASSASNNVTVTFNYNGTSTTQSFSLAANGSVTVDQTNDGLTGRIVGSATVSGSQPIAVAVNQTNGATLFSYTGSSAGSPTLYAPLLMNNNGGYTTGLQVQNVGSQATTVSLYLNGGSTAVTTASLNAGQSVTWYPIPGMTQKVESGIVKSSNGQPLLGAVNELNTATGQGMTYNTFGSGTSTVNMPLIMYNNSGYYTGEQIQNVGSQAATVNFEVNGQTVATQVIQPGQSYTWYGTNLIPGGGKVAGAEAVAQPGAQIVGIVNEITGPQQPGDTSFAYEGFNQ